MGLSAVFTPAAGVVNTEPEKRIVQETTSRNPGDIVLFSDGRVGVCMLAANDPDGPSVIHTFYLTGLFSVYAGTTVFADGQNVFWNSTLGANATTGYLLGPARGAKTSAAGSVTVDLNASVVVLGGGAIHFSLATAPVSGNAAGNGTCVVQAGTGSLCCGNTAGNAELYLQTGNLNTATWTTPTGNSVV